MNATLKKRHRSTTEPPPGRKHDHVIKCLSDRHIDIFALLDPELRFKYLTTEWVRYFVGGAPIYNSQLLGWLQERPNGYLARPKQQRASPNFLAKQAVYELAPRGYKELVARHRARSQSVRSDRRAHPRSSHRSNSYPHELIVDIGFYAPLHHAVALTTNVRLVPFDRLLSHPEVPAATRSAADPLLISLDPDGQDGAPLKFRFDGTPFVIVVTLPDGRDINRCVPGLQVDRGTRSLRSLERHVDHAMRFERERQYARQFGFDTCFIPFLITEPARLRHIMAYVDTRYGACPFLLFKIVPDFHQDLDHFPRPEHYDPSYRFAPGEWRPPETIHVITTGWQRVGHPDLLLLGAQS